MMLGRLTKTFSRRGRAEDRRSPRTLDDPELDETLDREGYVVVDLLSDEQVSELRELRRSFHSEPRSGWFSDFYVEDPRVKRVVNDRMREVFAPAIEARFTDHRSILHNFVINWPGAGGGLVLHQHSTVVDTDHRSVVVWCAVSEATEANGTLHVVPRSHTIQRGPRPERSRSWHEDHENQLLRDHLVSVPLSPGSAIVFDNQLLHCSFANSTAEPRVSAALVVIPRSAEFSYFEPGGPSSVRVHRLDPDFFIDNAAGDLEWAAPEGLECVAELDWAPTTVDATEIRQRLPRGTCSHGP